VKDDIDVSQLRTYDFSWHMPMWWGTLAFIALEGTAFAIGLGAYFYLMSLNSDWPMAAEPPGLIAGSMVTCILIVSAIPNHFLKKWAKEEKLPLVRGGLIVMSLMALVPLAIRGFEFVQLNISWDTNAYGSILWFLLGLHTAHLLTDAGDTLVLTALMFTRHATGKRFSDVEDNAVYWNFVVLSWLPIYLVLYWVPRW
jgi:cytochrome c oxidase subunit III